MTIPLRAFSRSLSFVLFAAAAAIGSLAPSPLRAAADDKKFDLLFSDNAKDEPGAALRLRPSLLHNVFVYVENKTDKDDEVIVQVETDGLLVEGTKQVVPVKANDRTRVNFGKQAQVPAPAAPGAAPAGPAPKAPPAALEEQQQPLRLVVRDKAAKQTDPPLAFVDLNVAVPGDYIELGTVSYNPSKSERYPANTLVVQVKAGKQFAGEKPCRVDLVLDRIPGLIDAERKGTRGGFVNKNGALTLTAEDLKFEDNKDRHGLVYLTVDGWQRAFTFYTTLPTAGGEVTPQPINNIPVVKLGVPPVANPGAPLPVTLEVDSNGSGALEVQLGFDRENDGTYSDIYKLKGDRDVHMLLGVGGPGGCLLIQPVVQDWKKEFDTTNVFGKRSVRVQVFSENKIKEFHETDDVTAATASDTWAKKNKVEREVILDATKPHNIKLAFAPEVFRGDPLEVLATTTDAEDDVTQKDFKVFFYLGKPVGGNPPPTAVKVEGKWNPAKKGWVAFLDAPTEKKGAVDVSAQVVKKTDVSDTTTVTVELKDKAGPTVVAPTGPKIGSIVGEVYQGGSVEKVLKDAKDPKDPKIEVLKLVGERPQPNVEVKLLDDKGAIKDATRSGADGKYEFKNVPPGSYRVTAVKTTDSTKGDTAALVVDGPAIADVKLTR